MALKSGANSYYDDWERRRYWKLETLERWTAECKERREKYVGKFVKTIYGNCEVVDVGFTEPGLIAWVIYRDADGAIHQMREDNTRFV